MLSGEYAVLFGEDALAFTIDRTLRYTTERSKDGRFHFTTELWPHPLSLSEGDLTTSSSDALLLIAAKQAFRRFPCRPLSVTIESEIGQTWGGGISSAVALGTFLSFKLHSDKLGSLTKDAQWEAAKLAFDLQKTLQGSASGYDILTQLVGGLVRYKPKGFWPGTWDSRQGLETSFHRFIHIYAGGKGAPTGSIMKETLAWLEKDRLKDDLCVISKDLTESFAQFFKINSTEALEKLFQANRRHTEFFAPSPHVPKALTQELEEIPHCHRTFTYKTTGSGGEDALLLIGETDSIQVADKVLRSKGWYKLPLSFRSKGVELESSDD